MSSRRLKYGSMQIEHFSWPSPTGCYSARIRLSSACINRLEMAHLLECFSFHLNEKWGRRSISIADRFWLIHTIEMMITNIQLSPVISYGSETNRSVATNEPYRSLSTSPHHSSLITKFPSSCLASGASNTIDHIADSHVSFCRAHARFSVFLIVSYRKNANDHFYGNDFFSLVGSKSDEFHSPGELSMQALQVTIRTRGQFKCVFCFTPFDLVEKAQFDNRLKSREFSGTRNAIALQRNPWNGVQWYADWKSDTWHAQANATWIYLLIKLNANKQNSFINNDDENEMIIKLLWLHFVRNSWATFQCLICQILLSQFAFQRASIPVRWVAISIADRRQSRLFCDASWQLRLLATVHSQSMKPLSMNLISLAHFVINICCTRTSKIDCTAKFHIAVRRYEVLFFQISA